MGKFEMTPVTPFVLSVNGQKISGASFTASGSAVRADFVAVERGPKALSRIKEWLSNAISQKADSNITQIVIDPEQAAFFAPIQELTQNPLVRIVKNQGNQNELERLAQGHTVLKKVAENVLGPNVSIA